MKEDKLYTVNKYNKSKLIQKGNMFGLGGEVRDYFGYSKDDWGILSKEAKREMINTYKDTDDYLKHKNAFGVSREKNAFSAVNIEDTLGAIGTAAASAVAPSINSWISNGYSTNGVGEIVGNVGGAALGAVGTAIGGPIGGAVGNVVGQGLGGVYNLAFGTKWNKKLLSDIQDNIRIGRTAGKALSSATTSSDFFNAAGKTASGINFNYHDLGSTGFLKSDNTLKRQFNNWNGQLTASLGYQSHGMQTGADNADTYQDSNIRRTSYANGGVLDTIMDNNNDMDTVQYDLATKYLLTRQKQEEAKDKATSMLAGVPSTLLAKGGKIKIKHPGRLTALKKRTGKTEAQLWAEGKPSVRKMITFARNARKWKKAYGGLLDEAENYFDLGGDVQVDGADFTTGLTRIDAGGSHEENPYEGVQVGVDNEGTPNLVEEGEVIFNDYVYSTRILADEQTKAKFHIGKKREISFADLAKKLEKEASERPNDPISKQALKAQMESLADEQERQKAEMEAEEARKAFESLSPEEQVAIMQQVAQAQQPQVQEPMQEQPVVEEQPVPEEAMMAQPQMMQTPTEEDLMAQQAAAVAANGGLLVRAGDVNPKVNKFVKGGKKARKTTGKYNKEWFLNQAKALGMVDQDAKEIDGFVFNVNDPEANLTNFNTLFRKYQEAKALDTYIKGQRQSKRNELFGTNGLYRMSNDNSKIYKARTNDSDRVGWITSDYTGGVDADGNLIGFISPDEYNRIYSEYSDTKDEALKKELKEQLAGYRRINERAGDKMYDWNGRLIEDLIDNNDVDAILDQQGDYTKDFKWDAKDAQTLQYPVQLEHSPLSYARYAPILGGAIGLGYDLLHPADYSRAEALIEAGNVTPKLVSSNYNPTYLTYKPDDSFYGEISDKGMETAGIRTLMNTVDPSKYANVQNALYNAIIANGQRRISDAQHNEAKAQQIAAHNAKENQTLAQLDLQAQMANQNALLDAAQNNARYKAYGYQMMDDIDARKNASISANFGNLITSIGNLGEEAYDEDRLKWLEGVGVLDSDVYNKKYTKYGGMLTKKKGGRR